MRRWVSAIQQDDVVNVSEEYGVWIEDRMRDIAARAGVPDFVFKPVLIDKGGARREVGDALLWIGHQLVVVSIKSRDPKVGNDSPQRRDAWLGKNIAKAISQINGTVRTLKSPPPGLVLQSERGVYIPWDPKLVDEISGAVVVDHNDLWEYVPDTTSSHVPSVVIAAEDWNLLHSRFASTASVVGYLGWRTRSGLPALPLEAERDIIASSHIAEADLPPNTPFEIRPGAWDRAWKDRPELFFGTQPDDRFARVIDAMIAGAAETDPLYSNFSGPADYLDVIEFLDRIPPLDRVGMGKGVIRKCESVGREGGFDALLSIRAPGLVVFLADSSDRSQRIRLLQGLTAARHSQLIEATGITKLTTLGIATEPSPSPGRSHDFFLLRAAFDFSEEERRHRDELFGPLPSEAPGFALSRWASSN